MKNLKITLPLVIIALVAIISVGAYLTYALVITNQPVKPTSTDSTNTSQSSLSDTSESSNNIENLPTTSESTTTENTNTTQETPICDSNELNNNYIDPSTLPEFSNLKIPKDQEANPDALGWMRYTDTINNFSYKVPFCWDKDLDGGYFKVRHPDDPKIYIDIAAAPTLASGMENAEKIDSKTLSFNNIPWKVDYWKDTSNSKLIIIAGYYDSETEYQISIWNYPESRRNEIEKIFNKVLQSVNFN